MAVVGGYVERERKQSSVSNIWIRLFCALFIRRFVVLPLHCMTRSQFEKHAKNSPKVMSDLPNLC